MPRMKTGAPRKEIPPEKMAEIEKAFRAGLMSWRAMSKEFGVGMSWLTATSERFGWTRDLTTRIQQDAQAKDQQTIARELAIDAKKKNPDYKLTEKEVTESNVQLIASVTGSHRATLSRARAMAEKLFDELEFAGNERELLENLAADLYAEKKVGKAEIIARLASIPGRTSAFKQLVDALKVIVSTEREVLRITDSASHSGDPLRDLFGALSGNVLGIQKEDASE